MSEKNRLTQYERFRVQAAVLVPLVRKLREELGAERGDGIVAAVLDGIARRQGEKVVGGGRPVTLDMMQHGLDAFAAGDALTYGFAERDETRFGFDVTRCRYAEHLDEIGARDLGPRLA